MFIFRRLTPNDKHLSFLTGDKAFDKINEKENLEICFNQDILNEKDYITYILLRKIKSQFVICEIC